MGRASQLGTASNSVHLDFGRKKIRGQRGTLYSGASESVKKKEISLNCHGISRKGTLWKHAASTLEASDKYSQKVKGHW